MSMKENWIGTLWTCGFRDGSRAPLAIRLVDEVKDNHFVAEMLPVVRDRAVPNAKSPVSVSPLSRSAFQTQPQVKAAPVSEHLEYYYGIDAKAVKPLTSFVKLAAAAQTAERARFFKPHLITHESQRLLQFRYPSFSQYLFFRRLPSLDYLF